MLNSKGSGLGMIEEKNFFSSKKPINKLIIFPNNNFKGMWINLIRVSHKQSNKLWSILLSYKRGNTLPYI